MPETRSEVSTKRHCKQRGPDPESRPGSVESNAVAFEIRPYRPGDENALLAVWNDAMWADPIDATIWRSRYLVDPNFRRETCLIADAGNRVAGFLLGFIAREDSSAEAEADRPGWILGFGVSADVRRRGIGTRLFGSFERVARDNGRSSILVGPYVPSYIAPGVDIAAYSMAVAFLDAVGAEEISRPLSMKASLTARRFALESEHADPDTGERVIVRAAHPHDLLPCLEFVHHEFPEWSGDLAEVIQALNGSDHRLVTLHVAMKGERCIGFALSRSERFGPFGVDPRERGTGIGSRLLEATLAAMRMQGFHAAWFLWTNDRAARLYQRHGFEEVRRFSLRRKVLR